MLRAFLGYHNLCLAFLLIHLLLFKQIYSKDGPCKTSLFTDFTKATVYIPCYHFTFTVILLYTPLNATAYMIQVPGFFA